VIDLSYPVPRLILIIRKIILKDIIYIYRNITESQIDELFSKYGNIVQKNILRDKLTGLPRGVAFVR